MPAARVLDQLNVATRLMEADLHHPQGRQGRVTAPKVWVWCLLWHCQCLIYTATCFAAAASPWGSPTSAILAVKSRAIRMLALFRSLCATCRPSKAAESRTLVGVGGVQSPNIMGAAARQGFKSGHKPWSEPQGSAPC